MAEAKAKGGQTQQATETGRTITVVSTRGEKKKIVYDAGDWAGLRAKLEREGYDLQNMKCVEGIRKSTLEHDKAILPEGNFHLFLMPYRSKLGAMSRPEINAAIKAHIAKDGDKAKEYFGQFGNYTQVPSAKLEGLLEGYEPGTKKTAGKEKATAIAQVVDSVKASKKETDGTNPDLYDEVKRLSTDDKLFLIISLLSDIKEGLAGGAKEAIQAPVGKSQEEIDAENKLKEEQEEEQRKKDEEQKEEQRKKDEKAKRKEEKRLQKQKELDQEDEALNSEMNEMMSGFNDIDKKGVSKVRSKVTDDDIDDDDD